MNFEKALEKLGTIVNELEEGNLSLDIALERYEEGIKLSKECTRQLQDAEKKVERLVKIGDAEFVTEPFDDEPRQAKGAGSRKTKKKAKRKVSDDDLLFS